MGRAKRAYFAMAVLSSVMCFALWAGSGCSPSRKARVGVLSQWEKVLGLKRVASTERRVAEAAPRCLKDRINVEGMQQEISRLEQESGGREAALARFQRENAEWSELSSGGFESLSLYGFYLKTGYSISLSSWLPDPSRISILDAPAANFRRAPVQEFRFNTSELQHFWKVALTIPEAYRGLAPLQTIHHVPPLMYGSIPGWTTDTCGESAGSADWGLLLLRSQCFESNARTFDDFVGGPIPRNDGIRGLFFLVVPHELSHVLDRSTRSTRTDGSSISGGEEWRSLSGWYYQTVIYSDGPRGRWVIEPGHEGFVRQRAGAINPSEDFAETAAWARYWPDAAAQASPRKLTFISENFFGGRTYDSAGLSKYYVAKAAAEAEKRLLEILVACQQQQPDCIENTLSESISATFESLRGEEWEACEHLDVHESRLKTEVLSRLRPRIARYVSERVARAPIVRALGELRRSLETRVDAREAYLHCYRRPQARECYQDALTSAFDRTVGESSVILGPLLEDERQAFLDSHSYFGAEQGVRRLRGELLSRGRAPTIQAAQARWSECLRGDLGYSAVADAPILEPFDGGEQYVSTSILNCINRAADSDVVAVRDRHIRSLGLDLTDSDARFLVRESLLSVYRETLQALLGNAASQEALVRAQRRQEFVNAVMGELMSNQSWLQNAGDLGSARAQCQPAAEGVLENYLNRLSPSNRLPMRFVSFRSLQSEWGSSACGRVLASPQVVQRINESEMQGWTGAMNVLRSAVAVRARDLITDCVARFPASRRAQCVTGERDWNAVEIQALIDWDQTSEGRAYASRRSEALRYLVDHREELQAAALNELRARGPSARR